MVIRLLGESPGYKTIRRFEDRLEEEKGRVFWSPTCSQGVQPTGDLEHPQ